jgi:hypothetical protein
MVAPVVRQAVIPQINIQSRSKPAGQGQYAALAHHSACIPQQGTFFFGQSDKLLGLRGYRDVIAEEGVW